MRGGLQPSMTWAEDRATQRCDPSADLRAKTEGRAVLIRHAVRPFATLRDWHACVKPSRHDAAIPRQDAYRYSAIR